MPRVRQIIRTTGAEQKAREERTRTRTRRRERYRRGVNREDRATTVVRWTHRSGDEDQRVNRACVTRAARGFAGRTSWHRWQIIIITTTKITTNRITARITTARLVESTRETWIWMVNRRRNGPSPLRVEKKNSPKKEHVLYYYFYPHYTHTNCTYRAIEESKREEFFVCITKAYFLYISIHALKAMVPPLTFHQQLS